MLKTQNLLVRFIEKGFLVVLHSLFLTSFRQANIFGWRNNCLLFPATIPLIRWVT